MSEEHQTMKHLASLVGIALLAAVLIVGRPASVSAHAGYDHSEPTAGSTVGAAPATVKIWFTETVQLSGSSVKVTNAAGQQVDSKDLKLDPSDADHKILVVSLNPGLPAGTYTVAWKSVSADDGDEDEGQFEFTVRAAAVPAPAAAPAPAAKPAAQPSPSPQAAPAQAPSALPRTGDADPNRAVPWLVFSGLLLVIGAAILRRARRV
jgi:methionine-rich copper-binding protein CopC